MPITDIVLLIIIGAFAMRGLFKGLVHELFGIAAIIVGFLAAYRYSSAIGNLFKSFNLSDRSLNALGFVIVFIVAYLVVMIIAEFLGRVLKSVSLAEVNRGGGMVFGAFKALVILSVILSSFVSFMPKDSGFVKTAKESAVSGFLLKLSPVIYDVVNKFGESHINPFRDDNNELMPDDAFDENTGQKALEKVQEKTEDIRDRASESTDGVMDKIKSVTKEEKDAPTEKHLSAHSDGKK